MRLVFLKKTNRSWRNIILMIFGMLIFWYFTAISISWGRFDTFNFLISLIGILMIFLSFKINFIDLLIRKCPKLIVRALKIVFVFFILSFVFFQSLVIYKMYDVPKDKADYVIILGCRVVGEYASLPLLSRGYTAIRYLKMNPETKVIVTGGQGPGESISEAEALRRLLLENKIDKEKILLEDRSKNTLENFILSNELYNLLDKNIVIVTSDYHMFRSLSMAKRLKYTNISGLPSKSQLSVLPAYLLREYVAIMYYKMMGRI